MAPNTVVHNHCRGEVGGLGQPPSLSLVASRQNDDARRPTAADPIGDQVAGIPTSRAIMWWLGILDPLQPPHWRWLIRDLHFTTKPTRRKDGGLRVTAVEHRPGSYVQSLDADRLKSYEEALAIRSDGYGTVLPRFRIEALILTGMDPDEIARRLGVQIGTVAAYEEMFFDARTSLKAKSYIFNVVVGVPNRPLSEDDVGVILKVFAFVGGPLIYDVVFDYLAHRDDYNAWLEKAAGEEERLLRMKVRTMVRARCMVNNGDIDPIAMLNLSGIAVDRWAPRTLVPKIPGFDFDSASAPSDMPERSDDFDDRSTAVSDDVTVTPMEAPAA